MKLIILNRDGVINYQHTTPIRSPDEWIPIPGSLDAIARLTYAAYRIVVKTDWIIASSGKKSIEILNRIHEKMHRNVNDTGGAIEAIFFSTKKAKTNADRHHATALLDEIAQRSKTNLMGVPFISSSLPDLEAAQTFGVNPILVYPDDETGASSTVEIDAHLVFSNLAAATDYLLTRPPKPTPSRSQ